MNRRIVLSVYGIFCQVITDVFYHSVGKKVLIIWNTGKILRILFFYAFFSELIKEKCHNVNLL